MVAAQQNDGDNVDEVIRTIYLDTPTVNVRLLGMNDMGSEVTVYLGDMINSITEGELLSPLSTLKSFYAATYVEKIHADIEGKEAVMNSVASADGLESDKFFLNYAMEQDLTKDQWDNLVHGLPVIVEYTYDDASSHGYVGYFTFQLTKDVASNTPALMAEDSEPDVTENEGVYGAHVATQACSTQYPHQGCTEPVETYTLNVKYTAYKLGETYKTDCLTDEDNKRPTETVHNDISDIDGDNKTVITSTGKTREAENNPGVEVGGENAGTLLRDGRGVEDKYDVHKVHVICGAVKVIKELDNSLISEKAAQTFNFTLTNGVRTETLSVTVKAREDSGEAFVYGLSRGDWVLTEDASEEYSVKSIAIETDFDSANGRYTNCYTAIDGVTALFRMGHDTDNKNVIGASTVTAPYTDYISKYNGIYGAAIVSNQKPVYKGEIPVEKIWFDGNEYHEKDSVLLVLYEGDAPALVDGEVQYLYLNKDNGWKGTFTVYLDSADDTVADHNYHVKEAVVVEMTQGVYDKLQDTAKASYIQLVKAEAEGTEPVFAKVVNHGGFLTSGDDPWFVQYGTKQETTSDGTTQTVITVTNSPARELPESGGMGTHMYTFSGLLCLITAALMYGYNQRRKRERGAE